MKQVNLSAVETKDDLEPIPSGENVVSLFGWEYKKSNSGKDYMNCEFKVLEGECDGRRVWEALYLTEAALWRIKRFAQAVCYPETENENGFKTTDLFVHAVGEKLKVKVRLETYKDNYGDEKLTNRIKGFKAFDPFEVT
jgi:hypothetical protein